MSDTFDLRAARAAFEARLATLERERFAARLWAHEDSLWSSDPAHRKVAANRLGWLDSPALMQAHVADLRAFSAEVVAEGFTHAVLLGMGGSSLAPEVLRLILGHAQGGIELTVLDNTSPAAVREVAAAHRPTSTLFIVSSKSGGTLEVNSFEKYFSRWVREWRGDAAARAFVAITDPGTSLAAHAAAAGYRRVFLNPPDIGGRYSALSYFGMVPAALIGADLPALLDAAASEAKASGPDVPAVNHPGLRLGAALGELGLAGRDKVTLVLSPEIAPLGSWIEQLVAESTGKDGKGLLPVADEPLATPELYGNDRVFVTTSVGALDPVTSARLDALSAAGHPVLRWTLPNARAIGAEFLRWEIATATAGAVIGVDPFDEPNVTEAKEATKVALERYVRDGSFTDDQPVAVASELVVQTPSALQETLRTRGATSGEPAAWLPALLSLVRPGDYVALLAYLQRTPERHERLTRLRLATRATTRAATTLGYGPRFLHSTGQLHKGGPDTGVFLQITGDEGDDLPIPGEPYGFAALRAAQAAGDYAVLERRGRRVLRVHLGADIESGLERLIESVATEVR
jgi:transaldolase / glucose-6-phosphate isomerase